MKLVINTDPRLLHIVRSVIRYCAQEAGFPEPDIDCLAMAINEAASNVIRHAYDNRRDARLSLEVLSYPDRVEWGLISSAVLWTRVRTIPPMPAGIV
jgi:serine/threonine-protein kinase RsbW